MTEMMRQLGCIDGLAELRILQCVTDCIVKAGATSGAETVVDNFANERMRKTVVQVAAFHVFRKTLLLQQLVERRNKCALGYLRDVPQERE